MIFGETIMIRAYKGGFQAKYGIKPDLTITGKTIGGGIPIGVVGGADKVMGVVVKDEVKLSGTHHGHRLACAAGIACLQQLDDVAYERLNTNLCIGNGSERLFPCAQRSTWTNYSND